MVRLVLLLRSKSGQPGALAAKSNQPRYIRSRISDLQGKALLAGLGFIANLNLPRGKRSYLGRPLTGQTAEGCDFLLSNVLLVPASFVGRKLCVVLLLLGGLAIGWKRGLLGESPARQVNT